MKTTLFLALAMTVALPVLSQRRITPINNPNTTTQHVNENFNPDSLKRANLVEMTDAQGRTILIDTVAGTEVVDSTALEVVPKMEYPLVNSAGIGVNIWDPVMRLLGQKYGLVEFSAEFNMHNRYIPVFKVGIGQADNRPDDNNYTYRSSMAPFFKIGMNYNFLYNSSSDYMAMAGINYGFTPFRFSINDVIIDSPYWQEEEPMQIPAQNVTAGYLEILFNLRVRIGGPIYLGWSFIFHKLLHETKTPYGKPWYIPGYGTRNMSITGAFTVTYTLDLSKKGKKNRKFAPMHDINGRQEFRPDGVVEEDVPFIEPDSRDDNDGTAPPDATEHTEDDNSQANINQNQPTE